MANFKTEKRNGYSIVTMMAENLDSKSIPELRSELVLLSGDSVKNIILDLSSCHHCDPTGLSAIMIAHRLCKDGHLILSGVAPAVETILSIQRFDPPLSITPDLAEAEDQMMGLL